MSRRNGVMSDQMKYEIARELGLGDKLENGGFANFTTREIGMIVRRAIEKGESNL